MAGTAAAASGDQLRTLTRYPMTLSHILLQSLTTLIDTVGGDILDFAFFREDQKAHFHKLNAKH
jgi:hypothetical protein